MRLTLETEATGRAARQPAGCLAAAGGSMAALMTPFLGGTVDAETFAALCDRQVRRV